MLFEVVLPKLGVSIDDGTLVKWYKKEGDLVANGDQMFLVETDKTNVDVEATTSGRLVKIIRPEGVHLDAGQVVGLISLDDKPASDIELEEKLREISQRESIKAAPLPVNPVASPRAESPLIQQPTDSSGPRISPSARRLMREYNIDPSQVVHTGTGGTIGADDVKRAIDASSDFKASSISELSGIHLTMARRLGESKAVPVTLTTEADVTKLQSLRQNFAPEERPSITEALIPSISQALLKHPEINSVFENNMVKIIENINLGIAVDTSNGLVVPVLKNANKLSMSEIIVQARALKQKALTSTLTIKEVEMGTFTITNLGMFNVEAFTPVVNPPQVAILGIGSAIEKAVIKEGQIVPRLMMTLSLTFDHRILDGATSARFLSTLRNLIEDPKLS